MKTHFTSKEIAHVWANKGAERGECPSAMSFNGDTFYSYGTAIARRIERKGKTAFILNQSGYSNSTSRHQGAVRHALPGDSTIFYIGDLGRRSELGECKGAGLLAYTMRQAERAEVAAGKARTEKARQGYQAAAAKHMESARKVNAFFGLRRKVDEKAIARLRRSAADALRREAKEREKREAKQRADAEKDHAAWIAGESVPYYAANLFPVAFRVEGSELVSSLGARVPVEAVRAALRFALANRANGWKRNGETCPVGMYQLESINAAGIVAGCHRIAWGEVERVAAFPEFTK